MRIFANMKAISDSKGVVIEGYANKFEVDSYKERMDPQSIVIDRFQKNPILLFNHDTNYPVGKVLAVESREDGVYCRARVSSVDDPKINYVRELVRDGTLCTFSVRFDVPDEKSIIDDPDHAGVKLIKNWELQEISIVSIPAQASSTFSLVGAKSLSEARRMVLRAKGANAAAYINAEIDNAVEAGADRQTLIDQLSTIYGKDQGEVAQILAGEVTPIPDKFVEACVDVLGCDKEELGKLDASDQTEKAGDEKADEQISSEAQDCVAEKIPKLLEEGKSQEEAVAIAMSMCEQKSEQKSEQKCDCSSKTKQAGQVPADTFALQTDPEGASNPMLMRLDSVVSQLGALNDKMAMMLESIAALAKTEITEQETETETEQEPAPMPEKTDDAEAEKALQEFSTRIQSKLKSLGIEISLV